MPTMRLKLYRSHQPLPFNIWCHLASSCYVMLGGHRLALGEPRAGKTSILKRHRWQQVIVFVHYCIDQHPSSYIIIIIIIIYQ
jgi:hypothetical protein